MIGRFESAVLLRVWSRPNVTCWKLNCLVDNLLNWIVWCMMVNLWEKEKVHRSITHRLYSPFWSIYCRCWPWTNCKFAIVLRVHHACACAVFRAQACSVLASGVVLIKFGVSARHVCSVCWTILWVCVVSGAWCVRGRVGAASGAVGFEIVAGRLYLSR